MGPIAGVDLGATNLRIAVADENGEVLATERASTPQGSDGSAVAKAIGETLDATTDRAGVSPASLTAVGIGTIGPLDRDGGIVVDPPNVPADRIPVVAALSDVLDAPITMHNDATTAAAGEQRFADTPPNAVYLTISSGIGAGAVVDGSVLSGWRGNAAEVGHFVVEPGGRRCGCGGTGHWEAYCSGTAIPEYARHLHDGAPTDLPLEAPAFSAADVFAAAGGDALADRTLERVAAFNALGVAALVHAYAPIAVYVGGGVALNNPEFVVDGLRDRLADHVMTNVPEIRLTTLGDDAVLQGALASAMTGGTGDPRRPTG